MPVINPVKLFTAIHRKCISETSEGPLHFQCWLHSVLTLGLALQVSQVVAELTFGDEYASEDGVSIRDELTISRPSPSPSVSANDSPPSTPLKTSSNRKKKASSKDKNIDNSLNALSGYFAKKKPVGEFATSMGQLVQSAADRLPFIKQVKLLEEITLCVRKIEEGEGENNVG
ncbi:hypothetical protein Pcinc_006660 [Petrolisthes cinctipes]|uniref:Uncharacterized protein n=1 Tax=Petrolisthes cinctipes TaxID=88211 RepID=A0AAE1K6W8_PETCI|nr:hypothetical protein Pcinc_028738 [Petrolisthes cinctipes]KAK3889343.1 hypothetical protein Pcinc_006660 [Petrolisthes cinctipes]